MKQTLIARWDSCELEDADWETVRALWINDDTV